VIKDLENEEAKALYRAVKIQPQWGCNARKKKHPLHVSNRLTIHHQEVVYCIRSIRHLSRIRMD
jgi:hypothetical protein